MNELLNLYSLLDQAGIFKEIYDTYSTVFLEAALAFALLNCFFGYKLRKVWSCIFGLLLGIGTGLTAAAHLDQPLKISLIAAGIGGLVCMMLAFLLYRIGMFFLCIGTVIMILFNCFRCLPSVHSAVLWYSVLRQDFWQLFRNMWWSSVSLPYAAVSDQPNCFLC